MFSTLEVNMAHEQTRRFLSPTRLHGRNDLSRSFADFFAIVLRRASTANERRNHGNDMRAS